MNTVATRVEGECLPLPRALLLYASSENSPIPSCYTMTKKSNHKQPKSQVMPGFQADARLSNPTDAGMGHRHTPFSSTEGTAEMGQKALGEDRE